MHGNLALPLSFDGRIFPVHCHEPSSLIAYTLSSLEYHPKMSDVPTQDIPSCRGQPTLREIENRIGNYNIKQSKKYSKLIESTRKSNNNYKSKGSSNKSSSSGSNNNNNSGMTSNVSLPSQAAT